MDLVLTDDCTAGIAVPLEDRSLEAIRPAANPRRLRHNLQFILPIGNDLSQLVLDIVGINGLTTHRREGLGRFLKLPLVDKVSW